MVYTDRALNHMSAPFKKVMLDIGDMLKEVYHAENAVIIPGSGTYAMEAVARHFATNKKVMVLRNGYFSYRWTHIFETCATPTPTLALALILPLTRTVLLLPASTHPRDVRHPAGAGRARGKAPDLRPHPPHPHP